jgi:hypothetical protein
MLKLLFQFKIKPLFVLTTVESVGAVVANSAITLVVIDVIVVKAIQKDKVE